MVVNSVLLQLRDSDVANDAAATAEPVAIVAEPGHEYRSLVENALEGMFRATPDGRVIAANPALVTLLGYASEAELVGRAHLTDWHAGGVDVEKIIATLTEQGALRGAVVDLRRTDGEVRTCLLSIRTVRDAGGAPVALEGIVADISERRRLEDALRASEERFRLLAEAAFEGVGVSESGVYLDVSQQFAQMLGYTREELIGEHVSRIVTPECLPRVLHAVETAYEGVYEVTAVREDGSRFPVEVRGRTMLVGERRLRVTAVRDITEQKRAHEELESQQQRLRSLAAALAVAEESERRLTATELHDEIGQGLAAAKLKLDALEEVCDDSSAGVVRDLGDMLGQIIARARALMTELSPPGIYDLDFVMALEWLAKRAQERDGLDCRVVHAGNATDVPPELRAMLFAAARELLRNVVRHAGVAEATLRVIHVPGRVELEVEDAGAGFDPGALAELPRATHGFGLFGIVERVRAFGGSIVVDSAPGRGTLVRIGLPLEAARGGRA
jgi:PAS domain S-box-containing protein